MEVNNDQSLFEKSEENIAAEDIENQDATYVV